MKVHMKNNKVCFNKSLGLVVLVVLAIGAFTLFATKLTQKPTSTNTRASESHASVVSPTPKGSTIQAPPTDDNSVQFIQIENARPFTSEEIKKMVRVLKTLPPQFYAGVSFASTNKKVEYGSSAGFQGQLANLLGGGGIVYANPYANRIFIQDTELGLGKIQEIFSGNTVVHELAHINLSIGVNYTMRTDKNTNAFVIDKESCYVSWKKIKTSILSDEMIKRFLELKGWKIDKNSETCKMYSDYRPETRTNLGGLTLEDYQYSNPSEDIAVMATEYYQMGDMYFKFKYGQEILDFFKAFFYYWPMNTVKT